MKRSRNYTWLVLGIITIILGILIPFVFMQQTMYFESEKIVRPGSATYNVTITSKEELENVRTAVVRVNCINDETREFEVYSIKSDKDGNKFIYEFQVNVTQDWHLVDEIDEIEIFYGEDSVLVFEKVGMGTKLPIAAFVCIIGGFMIFVNFFNNNAKNRTIELKEIIAASSMNGNVDISYNYESEDEKYSSDDFAQEVKQVEETKACEYCGTLSNKNETTCSSCGAKFKKQD